MKVVVYAIYLHLADAFIQSDLKIKQKLMLYFKTHKFQK